MKTYKQFINEMATGYQYSIPTIDRANSIFADMRELSQNFENSPMVAAYKIALILFEKVVDAVNSSTPVAKKLKPASDFVSFGGEKS